MWGTPHSSRWMVAEVASDRASTAGSAKSRVVAGVSSNARNRGENRSARSWIVPCCRERSDRLKIATTSESTAEGIGRLHTLGNDQTKNSPRLQPPAREGTSGRSRASRCAVKALQAERARGADSFVAAAARLLLEFLERVLERVEQPWDARSRHKDAARYCRSGKEGCDEIETELAGRVTDHHGIGVVAGKDVVLEFECS